MRTVGSAFILSAIAVAGAGALALTFTGCKADAGKADVSLSARVSSQQPVSQVAEDPRPLIVCFGDSLTAGYGAEPGSSYPDYLQTLLDQRRSGYRVVNAGVSGETTKDGLARLKHVVSLQPAVVVVEFGGNDGLRGLPVEQTQANLATMIGTLQRAGAKVALAGITLPPSYGPDYIRSFDAMYPALARQYHVPLLPFLLDGVYGVSGSMQNDDTHATAQGNQRVAQNVEALIEPLLKR